MRNLFASAVHFLFALGVLCLTLFFFGLSLSLPLRSSFFSFFNQPNIFFYLGILGLVFSVVLFVGFYFLHRKSFYQIKMQTGEASVDQSLVEEIIHDFFSKKMPEMPSRIEVFFKRKKQMEVVVYVSDAFYNDFYEGIQKWEKDLEKELYNKIGYQGKWLLTVTSL